MRCEPGCAGLTGVLLLLAAAAAPAQQPGPAVAPVASVATEGVILHGAMTVVNGRAALGNNGEVAAGFRAVPVALERGGSLLVCASTAVRIAKDAVGQRSGDAGLLFSLDRGAFEAHYTPGAYSDVILTPDLRLLVSGPGEADLKLRVNGQGDTCVDNAGENAPYVIASSLLDGGAYRVRPGQRVLFVHGGLRDVVDSEREPCGCPAPEALVAATPASKLAGDPGAKSGGPSSTAADTAFPTAVSEGLQAPPKLGGPGPVAPVVPNGQAHAQVTATLSSNTPPGPPPAALPPTAAAAPPRAPQPTPRRGFFGAIGHFFGKVFGAGS